MKYKKKIVLGALVLCASFLGFQPKQSSSGFSLRKPPLTIGNLGLHLMFQSVDSPVGRLKAKLQIIKQLMPDWVKHGGDRALLQSMMEKLGQNASSHHIEKAEKAADEVLAMFGDYDIVDERLVPDGFLDAYRILIWPTGKVVEAATLRRVKTWVENGGTLLIADIDGIHTVEGAAAFADLPKGKGKVIEIGKSVNDLESKFPGKLDARDGVLVSTFSKGILVFNRTDKPQVKSISTARGSEEITLAPLQFKLLSVENPK